MLLALKPFVARRTSWCEIILHVAKGDDKFVSPDILAFLLWHKLVQGNEMHNASIISAIEGIIYFSISSKEEPALQGETCNSHHKVACLT